MKKEQKSTAVNACPLVVKIGGLFSVYIFYLSYLLSCIWGSQFWV